MDAFLQPLPADGIRYTLHEEPAFVALPPQVAELYHPLIAALAAHWQLPDAPWALTCSRVDQRLRAWCNSLSGELPRCRALLADWGERLSVLPWAWQQTEHALARTERLSAETDTSLDARLAHFEDEGAQFVMRLEKIRDAAMWWQEVAPVLTTLTHTVLPAELRPAVADIARELATGEACFARLTKLQPRITDAVSIYRQAYQRWHDDIFGPTAIAALRAAFDTAEFRAVKWLARTPLPTPAAAARCLESLAKARSAYCPGDLTLLTTEGHCARCRLALDSPTPMPNATQVVTWAGEALHAYATLLATHPWSARQQARLPRAPIAIAAQATALLQWNADEGVTDLVALLDEPLLAWLNRDERVAGTRQVNQLSEQMRGRDMTRREAGEIMQRWLDPDETVGENGVLAFE
jgi:hypothetical protein